MKIRNKIIALVISLIAIPTFALAKDGPYVGAKYAKIDVDYKTVDGIDLNKLFAGNFNAYDLHLGYEDMLKESGLQIPLKQYEETIKELKNLLDYMRKENKQVGKIIFLGDIKHYFPFKKEEKFRIMKFKNFHIKIMYKS
jgi:hypothetical protein